MGMEYQNMKLQSLPAGLVIDNFIKGIDSYSYEDYLGEFVNASSFYRAKSNQQPYVHPTKEAHGECDCISHNYQMDFKLIASSSMLQAKNLFSPQIITKNGVTFYCVPKKRAINPDYKPIKATRIFAALRGLSIDDFVAIRNRDNLPQGIEQDIKHLIITLETNKHLLTIFPYYFHFDDNDDFKLGLQIAIDGLNSDFRKALNYREQLLPMRDTYLCFIYLRHFIITQWHDGKLHFTETVPIEKSPLFMKLLDLSDDGFAGDM